MALVTTASATDQLQLQSRQDTAGSLASYLAAAPAMEDPEQQTVLPVSRPHDSADAAGRV